MLKVILNNDTQHALMASDINHSVTMKIDNYSEHAENISLNVSVEQLGYLADFENVRIESLQVLDEGDNVISSLAFSSELYITNYSSVIYGSNATANVSINKINRKEG